MKKFLNDTLGHYIFCIIYNLKFCKIYFFSQLFHHFSKRKGSLSNLERMLVVQLCLTLHDPVDCSYQAPLSMGFSRQEYWSGLPFPSPGEFPYPGIKHRSSSFQADSFPSEPPGKP